MSFSVLFVAEHFWPRVAGGEVWSWELCKALAKKGLSVTVLTSQRNDAPGEEKRAGVRILRRGTTGNSLWARWSWQKYILFELRNLLKQEKFDIVHSMAFAANVPTSRAAAKAGVPSVTSVHSFIGAAWKFLKIFPLSHIYRWAERRNIKRDRSTVLHVPSFFLQALIKEETGEETVVLQNFYQAKQKQAISTKIKKTIQAMKKGKHILMVGSLLPVKNILLAIKAVAHIDATLWIVGRGPEEKKLKTLAKQEAPKKVRFVGKINSYEVSELMKKVDALAVTSYNESFSLVALEAVANGACVIGTPVGIIPELVHEDWQIVSDVDTLAHAMDKAKRKTPTKLKAYDKEKIVQAFIGLYKRLKCNSIN